MADGIGLSIGASELAAVVVGRAAVRRAPVLTLFEHRPPEVGVPSQNPKLDEPGLIITDFIDRVGDPVAILAADGSSHRGETLTADALRALLYALTRGRPPVDPVGVTHPAHWAPTAAEALRGALTATTEFGTATPVVSDALAALTALQAEPGLPARGIVALCDFGGTGTSVTLVDAANGYQPVAPTVRHRDLSGDLIDQSLLTHVLGDMRPGEPGDVTGTSAIGPLNRLRGQCRGAKERLSTATVTALSAELPGREGEVRLTRTELDEVLREPLAGFVAAVRNMLERNGIQAVDLTAVATAGGGARIPLITTTLSENFRVPVITTPQPELSAAIGAGLTAVRGGGDGEQTALAPVPVVPPVAAPVAADPSQSSTFRALAWSAADDIPDVVPAAYDEPDPGPDPRPQVQFAADDPDGHPPPPLPWYRQPAVALGVAVVAVVAALAAAVYFARDDGDTAPASTTTATTTASEPAPEPAAPPTDETPAPEAPPATQTVTETAPPVTEAPPPPTSEAPPPPPPTSEAPPPPPTTTVPPTTTAPPTTTTQPRLIPTLPYSTIPGLPFVPAPPGIGGQ